MSRKELLADLGMISYDGAVTDRDFFAAIASALVLRRKEKGVRSPNAVAGRGGPTQKTVEQIERGHIGRIDKLAEYAKAVDLTLVDLFRSVLSAGDRQHTLELEEIIRKYDVTTADGRHAIHATARAVPVRAPAVETRDARKDEPKETPRVEPKAAKRRGQKQR